jgi:hypothetical protein
MMAGSRIRGKERSAMLQQGQVLRLKSKGSNGEALWAYRYRIGGRDSKRVQRGGFRTERDAREALERELEVLRRVDGVGSSMTLAELVGEYLAQHDAEPVTIEKLRWLLGKALAAFGDRRLSELRPHEIAAWRMTITPGHRFEATQALRQVLAKGSRLADAHGEPGTARGRQPDPPAQGAATI